MSLKERIGRFIDGGVVMDDHNTELSPMDDDYYATKRDLENLTNPLSDDYCKYDNE